MSLEDVHLSEDEEQRVAEHKADDAHNDTNLHHLVLLDKTGRVGDGVWRRTDRQGHGHRCCNGDADENGWCAADAFKRRAHALAHNGEDRHEKSGCGGVRDEVGQQIADEA